MYSLQIERKKMFPFAEINHVIDCGTGVTVMPEMWSWPAIHLTTIIRTEFVCFNKAHSDKCWLTYATQWAVVVVSAVGFF